jgi:hypothetical protein
MLHGRECECALCHEEQRFSTMFAGLTTVILFAILFALLRFLPGPSQ